MTLEVVLVNARKQSILALGQAILVLMACVNVARQTLAVFQKKLAFLVRVCADPFRHVRVRHPGPIVIPQTTFVNVLQP